MAVSLKRAVSHWKEGTYMHVCLNVLINLFLSYNCNLFKHFFLYVSYVELLYV